MVGSQIATNGNERLRGGGLTIKSKNFFSEARKVLGCAVANELIVLLTLSLKWGVCL